jgi:hypothetical protein
VVLPFLPRRPRLIWDPACGNNAIVRVLEGEGLHAVGTDIATGDDFLKCAAPPVVDCILSNPPFRLSPAFVRHALALMEPVAGMVVMLLKIDWDSAKTRADLFDSPAWCRKIILRDRIRWVPGSTGSPSENHAFFIWSWQHRGPATLAYARIDDTDEQPMQAAA